MAGPIVLPKNREKCCEQHNGKHIGARRCAYGNQWYRENSSVDDGATAQEQCDGGHTGQGPDPGDQGVAAEKVGSIEKESGAGRIDPGFSLSGVREDVDRSDAMMLCNPPSGRELPAKIEIRNRAQPCQKGIDENGRSETEEQG